MTTEIRVDQGARTERVRTAMSGPINPQPVTGVFTGSEPMTGLIWPKGARRIVFSVTPTVAWTSGPDGTFTVTLTSAMTAAIPPGNYELRASATVGVDRVDLIRCDLTVLGSGGTFAPQVDTGTIGPTETDLSLLTNLYCNDEDIAVKCITDFTSLMPDSQLLAWGNDGVFSASDSWTLASVSSDFDTQLSPIWWQQATLITSRRGYVCWLRKPQVPSPLAGI